MKKATKNTKTTRKPAAKKQQKKKIVFTTLAVGAAGILGYFGWQYFKTKKDKKAKADFDAVLQTEDKITTVPEPITPRPKKSTSSNNSGTTNTTDGFPLKKGSKGDKVRRLQEALIAKNGKSILPRYGADGDFGTETVSALKKLGLSTVISQSTYNVLVQGTTVDNSQLAEKLYQAASRKDFNTAITLLKSISSKEEYQSISEQFKNYRINGGVRQTLVNGMLNTFKTATQKQAIRFEFIRMGLQYDGNKWSLSGFDGKSLITTEPTTVWVSASTGINVPSRMVLGSEVSRKLDYTLFENKGRYFLVQSRSVKNL